MARSANFDAEYRPRPGPDLKPDPELMATTVPPALRSAGRTRRVRSTTATTFRSSSHDHSSRSASATLLFAHAPAE